MKIRGIAVGVDEEGVGGVVVVRHRAGPTIVYAATTLIDNIILNGCVRHRGIGKQDAIIRMIINGIIINLPANRITSKRHSICGIPIDNVIIKKPIMP